MSAPVRVTSLEVSPRAIRLIGGVALSLVVGGISYTVRDDTSSKRAAGTAISVSGARFSASLAGQSVTTFVGKP